MRLSFDIESQVSSSLFRFEEGNGEIVDVWTTNETMAEYGTKCGVKVAIQRLDKNFKPTNDDPIEELLSAGPVDKFHPALASGPDDKEPQDLGSEEDVKGNCILPLVGKNIDRKSKLAIFARTAQEKGLKPAIFREFYAANLVGMKAYFRRQVLEKGAGFTGQNDPTALIVDKIVTFPKGQVAAASHASTGANGAPRPATTPARPAAVAPVAAAPLVATQTAMQAPAPEPEPEPAQADLPLTQAADAGELEDIATTVLAAIGEANAGQPMNRRKLYTKLVTQLLREKVDKNLHRPVTAIVKNPEWLDAKLAELGWGVAGDEFTVPA